MQNSCMLNSAFCPWESRRVKVFPLSILYPGGPSNNGSSSLCNLCLGINRSAPAERTLSRKKRLWYQPVAMILTAGWPWRICRRTSKPVVSGRSISIKMCEGRSRAASCMASSPFAAVKMRGSLSTFSSQPCKRERRIGDGSTSKNTGAAFIPPVFSFPVLNLYVGKS